VNIVFAVVLLVGECRATERQRPTLRYEEGRNNKGTEGFLARPEGYSGANVAPDSALGMTAWVAGKALRSLEWLCHAKAKTHP
jgi:hypothetical protein